MSKLLIVDDEKRIREMIAKYATQEGYDVTMASDGKEALDIYKNNDFDVVIMDIMMPKMDGYEAFNKMKEIKETHCIFLTALGEEYDRIYGFDIGGEDYVTKPFSLKELMLRVKVIINRNGQNTNDEIVFKGIRINQSARTVLVDNENIEFANKEYLLLVLLMSNIGKVITREDAITKIWGYEYYSDDRTLDTHIKLIRRKLKDYSKYITTIRGVGYRFEKEI